MPGDRQSNYYASDGYRYGVMFSDGSVRHAWTGESQRERAIDCAAEILLEQITYLQGRGINDREPDNITPCRMAKGGEWVRFTP